MRKHLKLTAENQTTQAHLFQNEERFQRLAENARDVIFCHCLLPQQRTEYINPAIAEITGYSPGEYYRDPQLFFKLIHPQDRHKWLLHLQRDREKTSSIILGWVDSSERIMWVKLSITPIRDDRSNLCAIEGIARELNEPNFLRFPTQAMSGMFSFLFDRLSSSYAGIRAGVSSVLVWIIYLIYATIANPCDRRLTAEIVPMSLSIGVVFLVVLLQRRQKKENEQLTQALQIANERLEKKVEQRTKAVSKNNELLRQEIDESQHSAQQLRWKEALLRSMTSASPLAFYVVDNRNDTILYFNYRFCEIWQLEHLDDRMQNGELKNNDLIPACLSLIQDVPAFAESCKPLQSEENRAVVEDEINFVDGRTIRRFSSQIRDESDSYFGRLYIFEDITARKQAEAELLQSSQALTEFSYNLKHLHRLNTTNYKNFDQLFEDYLETGCEIFECTTGIVTRIAENTCTIYAVKSELNLTPNQQFALNNTYCAAVAKEKRTIAYSHVGGIVGMQNHPLYEYLKLETYLGTPIFVDGKVYGSLSFLSNEIRSRDFSDREQEFIEMMAQSIGKYITADRAERERQQAEQALLKAKVELESRVVARTIELSNAKKLVECELAERKQAEAALRKLEKRWRSLLENVRMLVVGLDRDGKVEYVNSFFLELTGYTQAEIIGRDWFSTCISQGDRINARQIFEKILDTNAHSHYQNVILTKSGETKIILWNNTLLQSPQGIAIGTMSIGEDVTERHAIERMKDEFISVVSHELRTPLTSIHGALNLLTSKSIAPDSKQGRRVIEIAAESTERLVRLVNDILELERLQSGKIKLSEQLVNAAELMLQAIDQVQIVANRTGIELEVRPQEIEFFADGDRIIQVLINLLSNAIKFSEPDSKVLLTVERSSEQNILFSVKDEGRGIPIDKLESVFERFHQIDASDSRHKGGTGLGLAICRNIIEQHQGKIWVTSTFGKGSTFYISLPKNRG
jgi:PAS domain S-box-containing protein